jgi:hypothetical protein
LRTLKLREPREMAHAVTSSLGRPNLNLNAACRKNRAIAIVDDRFIIYIPNLDVCIVALLESSDASGTFPLLASMFSASVDITMKIPWNPIFIYKSW